MEDSDKSVEMYILQGLKRETGVTNRMYKLYGKSDIGLGRVQRRCLHDR